MMKQVSPKKLLYLSTHFLLTGPATDEEQDFLQEPDIFALQEEEEDMDKPE